MKPMPLRILLTMTGLIIIGNGCGMSDSLQKYPSLVPQLIIPGGTVDPQIATLDDLNRAYNLYLAWWSDNKTKIFSDFRSVNPLKDAVLMWR
jgi:hypothetical protein